MQEKVQLGMSAKRQKRTSSTPALSGSLPCYARSAITALFSCCSEPDPAQGEGNARLRNAATNRKEVAMIDFESSPVASIDGLRALYAQPNERVAKNRLTMSTRLGAHSSPVRHFWFLQREADKVSTARPRAISRLRASCRGRSDAVHTGPSR